MWDQGAKILFTFTNLNGIKCRNCRNCFWLLFKCSLKRPEGDEATREQKLVTLAGGTCTNVAADLGPSKCLFLQALSAHAYRCGVHMGEWHGRGAAEGTQGSQRANGRGTESSEVAVVAFSDTCIIWAERVVPDYIITEVLNKLRCF